MRSLFLLTILLAVVTCGCQQSNNNSNQQTAPSDRSAVVDTFAWERFIVQDSFILREGEDVYSRADYYVEVPIFTSNDTDFNKLVNDSLFAVVYGLDTSISNGHKNAYTQLVAANIAKHMKNTDPDYSNYNYEDLFNGTVFLNTKDLLVVEIANYSYAGGAHGFGASVYYNFINEPAKLLQSTDILQAPLDSALMSTLLMEHISDKELLYDPTEAIPTTDNIGISKKGLIFNYTPYEIGPYASGSIEILIPYGRLIQEDLLTDEMLQRIAKL